MHDVPATGLPPRDPGHPHDHAAPDPTVSARLPAVSDDRSPNAWVCPFLRAIDEHAVLGPPIEAPDPANRCAALHDAVPQSLRQQELVCLTSGHVNCPRYLRGSMALNRPLERVTATRTVTPATAGALAIFALAFMASLAFVVANGGLIAQRRGSHADRVGRRPGRGRDRPADARTDGRSRHRSADADADADAQSGTDADTRAPLPTATPEPTPIPKPKPTSDRYALLKPCPDAPDCYLYVVRSGDNLTSIARYFGVPLNTVKAMNPWTQNGLTVGRALRMPPPTR